VIGFRFQETMAGSWTPMEGGEPRPIRFSITARARSLFRHIVDHQTQVDGTLWMEGFASSVAVDGALTINPLLGRFIRYDLGFTADDGKRYRLRGQKDLTLSDPVGSWTTLPVEIVDDSSRVVAHARLTFDTRDLKSFLASFRPE
jgi:hypothetical protein